MPDVIVLEGAHALAGEYEFDRDTELTTREWGWVKRLSGYLPLSFGEGISGGDPELITALCVIALVRAERISREEVTAQYERLLDLEAGRIAWRMDAREEAEEEAHPPPISSSARPRSSGNGSSRSSESQAETLLDSGTSASEPSASVRAR
jgi:hypothetical protein